MHPAMLAAWSRPTLRPLVRTSSWTARWSTGNERPISTVGTPKRMAGRPRYVAASFPKSVSRPSRTNRVVRQASSK